LIERLNASKAAKLSDAGVSTRHLVVRVG
jgi:hypothetical protein